MRAWEFVPEVKMWSLYMRDLQERQGACIKGETFKSAPHGPNSASIEVNDEMPIDFNRSEVRLMPSAVDTQNPYCAPGNSLDLRGQTLT